MFSIQGEILDFCVLAIVNRSDTYGYEITQKLMATIEISESTLYPKDHFLKVFSKPDREFLQ